MDATPTKKEMIENYIQGYNSFDVKVMLRDLHHDVVFKNIANGEVTLETEGFEAFKNQAEQAKSFFTEREQKIMSFDEKEDYIEIAIDYTGKLAIDLPDGLKIGDTLNLKGKSVFHFKDDKIITIQDIS
ncbi:nuclear transport factor 2 family protein [Chondrinema litorale]|uniref:nuclear transport factor 2 family protein n=1 Tax=Chondrinema litorale TaxID=2994555 RepID=UPI002543627A|nr:nuclear transport factor 2 family protein [Chondrinema litorale]UZR94191.1 nuclear transport factor 2 family protein [Chondrinema litorale]